MVEEEICEYCGEVIESNQDIVYEKHDGAYHVNHAPENGREPTITIPANKREK